MKYTIGDVISNNQFDSLLDAIILAIFFYNGFLINFVLQSPLFKHSELHIEEGLSKEKLEVFPRESVQDDQI